MTPNKTSSFDVCTRLLQQALITDSSLCVNDRRRVQKALRWHQDTDQARPTLPEYMGVVRVIPEIVVEISTSRTSQQYLDFDTTAQNIIIRRPSEEARMMIEETQIGKQFDRRSLSFVPEATV